jgi:small subunit ribosomal protein S8
VAGQEAITGNLVFVVSACGSLLIKDIYPESRKQAGRRAEENMTMTDPIADMLTRIRNANGTYKEEIEMPSSKLKIDIASILKDEGYIENYELVEGYGMHKVLKIKLKYSKNRARSLNGIKRISRPGLRVYAKNDEIPRVLGGLGEAIISTSKGIITGKAAKKQGLGGEVICYVW